ncbi:fungal-specific transcription factor domain-containing protein [Aspergillus cavernicola]|uniref:Fungal-specific transcription factor domain-containing protein n=1 Tax=Aspergillus cavernicola TaxID=176166 RepID=A0ABR4IR94_9EURO
MDTNTPPVKRRRTREDRRRTARACDRCRRLKERCEGGIPCTRCIHLRRHCEFNRLLSQPQTPPVTSPYIPPLEVDVREILERVMYMEKILKHKVDGIDLDLDSLRRMASALDNSRQDTIPPEEDPIEEEVCTIDPVEDTTTHYSGEFSYWNFSMRVKRHIEDRMHPQGRLQVSNYWRAEQLHSGFSSVSAAIACCPPRHVADFLVNVFFKHAETYYFYVDRGWLIGKIDALYHNPERFGKKSAAVVSIILTVFAIATQYAYLDSPNQKAAGNTGREFSEDELGTLFYQQAIRFLPEIIESSSLESVQACLLFAVYALPVDASGLGYIYITLTVRLGMQNGMHRKYTGTGLSATMIETRNRVWWTAYTLERKISIFHGRPLSTLRFDVDAHLPKYREDMQCDATVSIMPYMVASVLLTQRLEEFSHELFLLRTCQKNERSLILSRLVTGKKELEAWWKTLPDEVHVDVSHHLAHFRSIKHLRLEYCLICMFVGRPLLLNRPSSTSPESTDNQSPSNTSGNRASNRGPNSVLHRQELVDSCIQAAREALNICRALRDNGPGLARTSYIEYSSCRASLLVLIAHSIQDQSARFRTELREGLDMIREMAAAGDSARSEVALLESLERALARLQYSSESNGGGDTDTSPADTRLGSDYECFKHWESMWKSGTGTINLPENSPYITSRQCPDQEMSQWQGMGHQSYRDGPSPSLLGQDDSLPAIRPPYVPDPLPFYNGDTPPTHPELRVLQEFLTIPGYRFDAGFGVESGLGSGVPFQG